MFGFTRRDWLKTAGYVLWGELIVFVISTALQIGWQEAFSIRTIRTPQCGGRWAEPDFAGTLDIVLSLSMFLGYTWSALSILHPAVNHSPSPALRICVLSLLANLLLYSLSLAQMYRFAWDRRGALPRDIRFSLRGILELQGSISIDITIAWCAFWAIQSVRLQKSPPIP